MKGTVRWAVCVLILSGLNLGNMLHGQHIPFKYSVIAPGISTQARAVGDIDGDQDGDVVLVEGEFDPPVLAWFEYPGWIRHDINPEALASMDYVADCELGDVDGDGDPDFIIPDSHNAGDKKMFLIWFENPLPDRDPRGTWKRFLIKDLGQVSILKEMATGDFDGDDRLDVVVRATEKGYIFFQNAPDDWTVREIAFRPHEGLEVGDIDRDGDVDFILNGSWWMNPEDSRKDEWIEYAFDPKWYSQHTGSWMDNNSQVRIGDINTDGCMDVVISSSEQAGHEVAWYEAPVDPANGPWIEHVIGQMDYCHSLKVADMEHDGDVDILAAEMVKSSDPDKVVIYINEGHPRDPSSWRQELPVFREEVISDSGAYWAVLGDVGGDGDPDIVSSRSFDTPPIEMWENLTSDEKLPLDNWQYIQVDDNRPKWGDFDKPEGKSYFGLTAGDLNNDGYSEIITGRYAYVNPRQDMTGNWERMDFGQNMDAQLITDVDGDELGDIIAVHCEKQFWIEPWDKSLKNWNIREVSNAPVCMYGGSPQGYHLAQIIPGGKPEIILTDENNGIYLIEIPENPESEKWIWTQLTEDESTGEGIASADMDDDGDIDICSSLIIDGRGNAVAWWENPGNGKGNWKHHVIGMVTFWADRFEIADLNQDGMPDIIVTDELCCPGDQPIVDLFWFEQFTYYEGLHHWRRHAVVKQYSMNSLDAADIDRDGDIDLITGEHKGPDKKVQIWENNGRGQFEEHLVDKGKESHLGTQLFDLDGDGDLDIVSIAWDESQYVHLWRNDAIH